MLSKYLYLHAYIYTFGVSVCSVLFCLIVMLLMLPAASARTEKKSNGESERAGSFSMDAFSENAAAGGVREEDAHSV